MDAAQKMDQQYRYQRYVYDLSRKYYLLGRDALLAEIPLQPGESLLEIGCGTGRNLTKLAYRYPAAQLYGIDASNMMLVTAANNLRGTLYENKITLRQGLAGQISHTDFGLDKPFDHIVFSYVLSMIPGWQDALEHALSILKPRGCLHVVDFSDQQTMPAWFRRLLLQWLDWFHVHPDPAVPAYLEQLAARQHDQLQMRHLSGRYALLAHYQKGEIPNDHQSELPHLSQYLDF
jgi:S-adenosylmethionine-diacylgycerolhomoserine-N-methlytransferase